MIEFSILVTCCICRPILKFQMSYVNTGDIEHDYDSFDKIMILLDCAQLQD